MSGHIPVKIRILLADDHQMFRDALCHLLQSHADLQVVGQTGDGAQVVNLAQTTAPHIVCMDINMPGLNGIEATRQLLAALPLVKVVALSTYLEQRYVLDMLKAGANGYVAKAEASDELLRAIRAVLHGRTYLCPDAAALMAGGLLDEGAKIRPATVLGKREQQVLKWVADGFTSNQISEKMQIAAATVEVHRRNIMRKLDRHSVAELTRYVVNCEQAQSE